jgi:hypothetical protein
LRQDLLPFQQTAYEILFEPADAQPVDGDMMEL